MAIRPRFVRKPRQLESKNPTTLVVGAVKKSKNNTIYEMAGETALEKLREIAKILSLQKI